MPVNEQRLGRVNLVIDPELKEWAQKYAKEHYTTVTAVITRCLVDIRQKEKALNVEQI